MEKKILIQNDGQNLASIANQSQIHPMMGCLIAIWKIKIVK